VRFSIVQTALFAGGGGDGPKLAPRSPEAVVMIE
jgi:hypothetical protein